MRSKSNKPNGIQFDELIAANPQADSFYGTSTPLYIAAAA